METRIEAVLSSLELDVDDVRMIGIWGMGGGGKTTLARAVFDRISSHFDGKSFVENVREVSNSSLYGLNKLQQQVLSSVLSKENITVSSVHEGTNMMKRTIRGRKVLIVLDDVDDIKQLEALAGEPDWFKLGSRVIITTRDKQVLLAHQVKFINDVNLLSPTEAICLLRKHAFKRDIPIEGHEELSRQVVKYADGLPLTIKVLGSMLYGQNEPQWIDTLERLKKIPLKATMEKLELSYNSLEEDYKEIFLDVACILKGWRKDDAVIALESCGFYAEAGLRVLEQKSLITIVKEELQMHDHIKEMGRNIVRQNPNELKRHSRLWINEEIEDILDNDSGTQPTKCMILIAKRFNYEKLMKGLANMKELRFLDMYVSENASNGSIWTFDEVSRYLPNSLRFLSWNCPFSSLPKKANNHDGLKMEDSNFKQKAFSKLRFLKFTNSKLFTFDDSVAPNLETLILQSCEGLVEVNFQFSPNLKKLRIYNCTRVEKLHMPGESPKLRSLDLSNLKLRTLHLGITPILETLSLSDCADLVELSMPAKCPKLVNLKLSKLKLETLHLGVTPILETLSLSDCTNMVKLLMHTECPKLINLALSNLKLETLDLRITPNLEELWLSDCTNMEKLHMNAEHPKLVTLYLRLLKLTTLNLAITPNLKSLILWECTDMVELQIPAECPMLVKLELYNLKLKTLYLRKTPNLEKLTIIKCIYMTELQIPAECPKLVDLELTNLKLGTLDLGITPNLETLKIWDCTDMVELRMPAECPKLVNLNLNHNAKLRTLDLGLSPNLRVLFLKNCYDLKEVNAPAECLKKLRFLDISHCGRFISFQFPKKYDSYKDDSSPELHLIAHDTCYPSNNWPEFQFSCFYKEDPASSSFGNLERLISLGFGARINVDSFSDIICGLQCLRKLTLVGGIPEAPKNLDQLDCLEELSLWHTNIKTLPGSICMLKKLKSLEIKPCHLLERLPEEIGRLEELNIPGISHLPHSLYGLRGLRINGDRWLLKSCVLTPKAIIKVV